MNTQRVIDTTRKRLLGQRGRYRQIAQHGCLTYSWVSKFASGEIGKRPSYDFIQRLIGALDAMEREAGRSGKRRERVHAGTVRGRKTLAKPRIKQRKANTRKTRG